jgi:hypothetical protein
LGHDSAVIVVCGEALVDVIRNGEGTHLLTRGRRSAVEE